jgi:HK97 family phage major capsid protein
MNTITLEKQLIGYPYQVTRNAAAMGHRGDITLGDFGYYILAIRKEMTIDVSNIPLWFWDETCVRFVARLDGKPATPWAFKILSGTGS